MIKVVGGTGKGAGYCLRRGAGEINRVGTSPVGEVAVVGVVAGDGEEGRRRDGAGGGVNGEVGGGGVVGEGFCSGTEEGGGGEVG